MEWLGIGLLAGAFGWGLHPAFAVGIVGAYLFGLALLEELFGEEDTNAEEEARDS